MTSEYSGPTTKNPALKTWTPERQKEVNESTPENPVHLTLEELHELREANQNVLQHEVGRGRFTFPAREGSPAAKALALKDKGYSNAAIANELGISESVTRRILTRVR